MKYMLTIQHDEQKVAYIEFTAENDESAKIQSENIFNGYKSQDVFMTKFPYITGNFTGYKPRIISHRASKWVASAVAQNAWGMPCGGYWSNL